jgi:hypothetical protein
MLDKIKLTFVAKCTWAKKKKLIFYICLLFSVMTSNGDHTWGWLGSTEQFGRISELNEFIEIPKSQLQDEKYACFAQAAHCFIYAENSKKVFNIYHPRATILVSRKKNV